MEKTLNIVQRFRVQLIVNVDRESLRWVIEGEDDGDKHETGDAAAPDGEHAPPSHRGADALADDVGDEDDDDAEFDAEDEEEDIDDFVVDSDEDADEAISSESDDVPIPRKRIRRVSSSDDGGEDAAPVVAALAPVSAANAATAGPLEPVTRIVPARRVATRETAHAELTVTEFGIRGAMLFSAATEALFQRALVQGARSADQVFEVMRGVPGLRISDVHVRLWQLRSSSAAEPSTMKGVVVVVFLDGAFRHARVVEESGNMLRLQMLASRQGELVWVQMQGGRTMLYIES
jgi:hypothetical protein